MSTCPPKSPDEWVKWIEKEMDVCDSEHALDQNTGRHIIAQAVQHAQEQAFNQGVNSERHKTKVVPNWMLTPYYEKGRKEAIQECQKFIDEEPGICADCRIDLIFQLNKMLDKCAGATLP